MHFRVAERIQTLPHYPFVEISANVQRLKAQGVDVIRLDMGSPDMPPPEDVRRVMAQEVMENEGHGYTGYRGTPEFRKAVARYYKRLFNVDLDPEKEVLPLIGSKEGIVNLTLALVGNGDTVLVPSIGYPAYEMAARLAGGRIFEMMVSEDNNYLPSLEEIPSEAAFASRLLWMNYPNNPTGVLATVEDYAQAVEFCREHGILLASDNPYFHVTFDGDAPVSALQVPGAKEVAVEFMSMSKSHNMAGWRMGACVGNANALSALLQVKSNMDSGHFTPAYEAAVYALDHTPQDWIDARNEIYRNRRDMLLEAAPSMGLEVRTIPKGALYLWAVVKTHSGDDVAYCSEVLEKTGVSVVPGAVYGKEGRGYVRVGLTTPDERLAEAIDRIVRWAGTL